MSEKKNIKIKISKSVATNKKGQIGALVKQTHNYQRIIQDTIINIQNYKSLGIISKSDLYVHIQILEKLFIECSDINDYLNAVPDKINITSVETKYKEIEGKLLNVFKTVGCGNFEDLIDTCFGSDYLKETLNEENIELYKLLKRHIKPIRFINLDWKDKNKYHDNKRRRNNTTRSALRKSKNENNASLKNENRKLSKTNSILDNYEIVEKAKTFDCFDLGREKGRQFIEKVYGVKIALQNIKQQRTIVISGICEDVVISCLNNKFVNDKLDGIIKYKPKDEIFFNKDFDTFVEILTLKDLIIYDRNDLYKRYRGYLEQIKLIKLRTIADLVNTFVNDELYKKRRTLIYILMKKDDPEFQYLSYMLYDLLPDDEYGNIDNKEQNIIYDSLPWVIQKFFGKAMETAIKYSVKISNYDNINIPIEKQICLMKVSDSVKEKAMTKLNEVKSKSEDSGSKARQYLDGLLKIPFGIYKEEEMLKVVKDANQDLKNLINDIQKYDKTMTIEKKDKYNIVEINKHLKYLNDEYIKGVESKTLTKIKKALTVGKRSDIERNLEFINKLLKKHSIKKSKICHSGLKKDVIKKNIEKYVEDLKDNKEFIEDIVNRFSETMIIPKDLELVKSVNSIQEKMNVNNENLKNINSILNNAVHGHDAAKRQVERIIGQWMSGEQSGYCLGFEGPPGVGKTSLAKNGLSICLKDKDGNNRPFSFIALGGSTNGSTLSGHSYTYAGSTWGKIVDTLMQKKCMNPIIFIDELDKVSRTEQGKEIIGILTHLTDSTQNENFQDKYFSGIDINLSKVLFVFSYNDPSLIDKILLDRIHRVKFKHLTLGDKIEISKSYLLPEIFKKFSIQNTIVFNDEIIKHIIDNYTVEAGVRKLKEIFFEIVSEINLEILNGVLCELPVILDIKTIDKKYLKDRHKVKYTKIHEDHSVGLISGLWANSYGMGGIIPIECNFLPASSFLDMKLTGMQGDVMKESMNVAKTLAWKLTTKKQQGIIMKELKKNKAEGIHIHCPEGATPKDGPSAGTAITTVIYSILNKKKIKHDIAITGEINLQGKVTEIGGLDLKILGGIRAGVKEFIFPKENEKDFKKLQEKYEGKDMLEGITFHSVSNINEVLKLVFI